MRKSKVSDKPEITIRLNCKISSEPKAIDLAKWINAQAKWLFNNWQNCSKTMTFRKFGIKTPDKDKLNCTCKRPLYKNDKENCQNCGCPIDRIRNRGE